LLIEYGFNTLNLHRIELTTFGFNVRALKSYLKIGFQEEGRRREAIFANGEYHDSIMLGLLRSEWNSSKS
jgi:RimJ/RimL family protein N-acetyltransferase